MNWRFLLSDLWFYGRNTAYDKREKNLKALSTMLVLASQSPSRYRLLTQLGVPFVVDAADIDETPLRGELPKWYVQRVSTDKARAVAERHAEAFILAADTIVTMGTRIFRKAESAQEASSQLHALSGRRHRIYTHLCLRTPHGQFYQKLCVTHVAFKVLEEKEIQAFVASEQWRGVAVYEHEGFAARFIQWMRGLPSTIKGLPLFDTYQILRGHGLMGVDTMPQAHV